MTPGQAESDKDRLLLFQEKEQLLRELRSMTPRSRTAQEMTDIQQEVKRLERDLNQALELNNRAIADRYVLKICRGMIKEKQKCRVVVRFFLIVIILADFLALGNFFSVVNLYKFF